MNIDVNGARRPVLTKNVFLQKWVSVKHDRAMVCDSPYFSFYCDHSLPCAFHITCDRISNNKSDTSRSRSSSKSNDNNNDHDSDRNSNSDGDRDKHNE